MGSCYDDVMGLHWQKYGKSLYPKHAPHTAAPLLSAAAILAVQPPRTLVLAPLEGEGGVLPAEGTRLSGM